MSRDHRLQRHLAALNGDLDGAARAALHALLVEELLHLLLVARHLLLAHLWIDRALW